MTDIATLGLSVDSDGVLRGVEALDRFSKSAQDAGKSAEKLGSDSRRAGDGVRQTGEAASSADSSVSKLAREASELQRRLERATSAGDGATRAFRELDRANQVLAEAQAQAAREVQAAKAAYSAGEKSLEEYNRTLINTRSALSLFAAEQRKAMTEFAKTQAVNDNLREFGQQSRAAAFAARNLIYQIVDMAQGFALGMPPMMIMMQQLPQAADAFSMLAKESGGAGRAIAGLAARFGPLVAVAGAAAAGMWAWTQTVNAEKKGELDAYAKSLGLTAEQIEKAGGAAITASDLVGGLWDVIREALGLEEIFSDLQGWIIDAFRNGAVSAKKNIAEIYAAAASAVDGIRHVWQNIGPIMGEAVIAGANIAISAIERLINNAIQALNLLVKAANPILAVAEMAGIKVGFSEISLPRISNVYARAGEAAAKAFSNSYEQHRLRAEEWMQSRIDEIETAAAARRNARLAEAAEENNKKTRKAAERGGKSAGDAFAKEFVKAMANLEKAFLQALVGIDKRTQAALLKQIDDEWAQLVHDIQLRARVAEDATTSWNDQLRETVNLLDQISSHGRALGDIGAILVGLTSGDWSGSRGPVGHLLRTIGGIAWGAPGADGRPGQIRLLRDELVTALDTVFGGNGTFAKTMNSLLQGAGAGAAIGSIAFSGSKAGQLGATLGGAAGQALGTAFSSVLGKLGAAAGPLGAIAGSLLGGLVGGLFRKTKKGAATFTEAGLVGTAGNNATRIAGATSAGRSAMDAFRQLLDQLDATATGINFSTGIRKDSFVLDPTGQGRTKGAGVLNFGKDEQAYMEAVFREILSDATFHGLSEGFQRLLKNPGDIEAQLQKVFSLKGVFDELASIRDPEGFALANLDKEFAKLREYAIEAGEGLAEVEELYGIKRKEIIDKHAQEALDRERRLSELQVQILTLEGKETEALALARRLELEGLHEAEAALVRRIHALQDEAIAAAEAAAAQEALERERMAIAQERRQLEIRLAEALGREEDVLRMRREDELAATHELNRGLLQQIHAAEDAARAQAALAQAQQQAAQAAISAARALRSAAQSSARGFGAVPQGASVLDFADNPAVLGAASMFAAGNQVGARRDLVSYLYDEAKKALPSNADLHSRFVMDAVGARSIEGISRAVTDLLGDLSGTRDRTAEFVSEQMAFRRMEGIASRLNSSGGGRAGSSAGGRSASAGADDRASRIEAARSRLTSAYQREASALQQTIDRMRGFADSLRDFRDELLGATHGFDDFAMLARRFRDTSALAIQGDVDALGNLPGVSKDYLDAARRRSSTLVDYQAEVLRVRKAVGDAMRSAEEVADYNAVQLEALERQVQGLVEVRDAVVSVEQAIRELRTEMGELKAEQRESSRAALFYARRTSEDVSDMVTGTRPIRTESA